MASFLPLGAPFSVFDLFDFNCIRPKRSLGENNRMIIISRMVEYIARKDVQLYALHMINQHTILKASAFLVIFDSGALFFCKSFPIPFTHHLRILPFCQVPEKNSKRASSLKQPVLLLFFCLTSVRREQKIMSHQKEMHPKGTSSTYGDGCSLSQKQVHLLQQLQMEDCSYSDWESSVFIRYFWNR